VHGQPITEGRIEFGNAEGQPGETVKVPIVATFDEPLLWFNAVFTLDGERLQILKYDVTGSAMAGVDPLAVYYKSFGNEGIIGIYITRLQNASFRVPPGERVNLGAIQVRIRPLAQVGSTPMTPVPHIQSTAGGTEFGIDVNGSFESRQPSAPSGG